MKNVIFIWALLFTSASAFAQKLDPKDVPAPVMTKFSAFYSDAVKVKWEKEGNNYEAEFKDNNKKKMSVTYTPEGNLAEKEWEISKAELPKTVSDTLSKKFPGAKISETEKIDKNGINLETKDNFL